VIAQTADDRTHDAREVLAALTEQRMRAPSRRVGAKKAVEPELFAGLAEQRRDEGRDGEHQEHPVAAIVVNRAVIFVNRAVIFVNRAVIFVNRAVIFVNCAVIFVNCAVIFVNRARRARTSSVRASTRTVRAIAASRPP
jgi:hypothetical protein